MKSRRAWTATAAAFACAVVASAALGQNADPNTGGPTKNTYRLRLVEPAEGATIVGDTFQVVVDLRTVPEVGSDKKDSNSMPRPRVDVYLDNEHKGTLQETTNVLTVDAPPGAHKLVVMAKNVSGEIIDREEVGITLERSAAATMAPASSLSTNAPAPPRATSVDTSMAPRVEPSRPAPVLQAQSAPAPVEVETRRETLPRTLPETATLDPLLVLSGVMLVITGFALRRRARA